MNDARHVKRIIARDKALYEYAAGSSVTLVTLISVFSCLFSGCFSFDRSLKVKHVYSLGDSRRGPPPVFEPLFPSSVVAKFVR